MVKYPTGNRVECLNQIRPGKICGTHLPAGKTWCPVCGERTITRRVAAETDFPRERVTGRTVTAPPARTLQFTDSRVPFNRWRRDH